MNEEQTPLAGSSSNQHNIQNQEQPQQSSSSSEQLLISQSTANGVTIDTSEQHHHSSSLRSTMERRIQERAQNWRYNFTNAFQALSPVPQQFRNINAAYHSWLPNANSTLSNSNNHFHGNSSVNLQQPSSSPPAGDSYVINLDGHGIQATGFAHIQSARHSDRLQLSDSVRNVHEHQQQPQQNTNNQQIESPLEHLRRTERNLLINDGTSANNIGYPNHHHHHHHHHHNNNTSNQNNPNNNNGNNLDDGPMSEAFQQIPEARALFVSLLRYTPYICIILAKTCYDHLDGILDFIALFITFSHANWMVRQEVGKQGQRSIIRLLRELFYIIIVISIIGYMLETKNIYVSLKFANNFTHPFTLRQLLFSVAVTDLILKLITVGIKIIITMMPARFIEYKRRGRIFLMTEAVSQLYRGLAPIQPWLVYLLDAYTGSEKFLGVGFSAVYMVAKGSDIVQTALFLKRAFIQFLKKVSFGTKPSKEQLQTAGGQCPICHDAYTIPVMLECSHIFCELCVGTWFDREQTCPLCRAKVADDPSFRDGATTQFVQLF